MDDWLRHKALTSEARSVRSFVVCAGRAVVGYYCLAAGAERRENLPRKLRHGLPDPTPLTILGRLAVDRRFQGQRLGMGLLQDALQRAAAAAQVVGSRAVLVHAIDDRAAAFYAKFGFREFPGGSRTFFLPMETIAAAL